MTCLEHAITFNCKGELLVGVVAQPAAVNSVADTGVVIVVGGPQFRVGSHRQFVHLARHIASAGYPVLRFDVRGMGDSAGAMRGFESLNDDVDAAIDAFLRFAPQVKRVVLWGLCDGASAALLHCSESTASRVAGICLLNPWARSETSLAVTRVKHYYLRRLREPAFWSKLFHGKIGRDAAKSLLGNLQGAMRRPGLAKRTGHASFQDRMAAGWSRFRGPLLLMLSDRDHTAQEFVEYTRASASWQGLLERPTVDRRVLIDADHTLSSVAARTQAEQATLEWMRREYPSVPRAKALPAREFV